MSHFYLNLAVLFIIMHSRPLKTRHKTQSPNLLLYKTSVVQINLIGMETSNFLFKGTYDDVKFKLKVTSYFHVHNPLGGIDLVRDQAIRISF